LQVDQSRIEVDVHPAKSEQFTLTDASEEKHAQDRAHEQEISGCQKS
jgi:hypothetical protein